MGSRHLRISIAAAVVVVLCTSPGAIASYSGNNGKIAFHRSTTSGPNIHTVNPDGSGEALLVSGGESPAWSADGNRIAYSCNNRANTCTAAANGSGEQMLPNNIGGRQQRPYWSPDGARLIIDDLFDVGHGASLSEISDIWRIDSADGGDPIRMAGSEASSGSWSYDGRIAYTEFDNLRSEASWIATMQANAPNTGVRRTTTGQDRDPDWSPDATKLVFSSRRDGNSEIYVMNADGSNQTRLTTTPGADEHLPTWSPDGTKVAYERHEPGILPHIWKMNADGTGQTDLGEGFDPAWQPTPYPGYPRPASATPVNVSLVPAFESCADPNRVHGSPLAHPSCAPPDERAGFMTFGAAPAGTSPKAVGRVRIAVRLGATPDESDVGIAVRLTDVRRGFDLADGLGSLELQVPVRITDRHNGFMDSVPATVQDVTLRAWVPCAETADATIGSTCSVTTSAEALMPYFGLPVHGGKRAVWQFGQISVWDGGDDGYIESPEDNKVLAVQGVFVP